MVAEINRYGYRFSLSRFWRLILLAFAATGGVCLWFELHPALTAAVLLSVLMCMPKVMLSVYHSLYEQKRFADVNNYLEQMMFSFQKRPNILFCLKRDSTGLSGRETWGNGCREPFPVYTKESLTECMKRRLKSLRRDTGAAG